MMSVDMAAECRKTLEVICAALNSTEYEDAYILRVNQA